MATQTPEDKPPIRENGHFFAIWKGAGDTKGRYRCQNCKTFRDQLNPPEKSCTGVSASHTPPSEHIKALCNDIEKPLGSAIRDLIDGFKGHDGEGPAWEAGKVAAGHVLPESGALEQLIFLVQGAPVALQYDESQAQYTITRNRTTLVGKNFKDLVHEHHAQCRPPCPKCGSRQYVRCFGEFRHQFEPTSCDQCTPSVPSVPKEPKAIAPDPEHG